MRPDINECEQLRTPDRVYEPDSRSRSLVTVDRRTGRSYPRGIKDQYKIIAQFELDDAVPEQIAIHFETAKNLYLYAWFVFRFYPVSEQQALASLEFALRERFPDFVRKQSGKRLGLKRLLKHAIENGYIRNELFTTREQWAWRRAEMRFSHEKILEMMAAGVESIEWDESEVVVTQDDLDFDWLGVFQETIPEIRNRYAHGSSDLKHSVLHTFEMVVELLNQLYAEDR